MEKLLVTARTDREDRKLEQVSWLASTRKHVHTRTHNGIRERGGLEWQIGRGRSEFEEEQNAWNVWLRGYQEHLELKNVQNNRKKHAVIIVFATILFLFSPVRLPVCMSFGYHFCSPISTTTATTKFQILTR